MNTLADSMKQLSLDTPPRSEPFSIPTDPFDKTSQSSRKAFDQALKEVPRYLFRLYSRYSVGSTDTEWVKSAYALAPPDPSEKRPQRNIVARSDKRKAAKDLHGHLAPRKFRSQDSNLVSWSSSLLFVLRYGVFLNQLDSAMYELADTHILVVDTTRLPAKSFVSDIALMRFFGDENEDLLNVRMNMRENGRFYTGEYLSQSALHVQGCCTTFTMLDIYQKGLYHLRDDFDKNGRWMKEVNRLREAFNSDSESTLTRHHRNAIEKLAELFEAPWRLPMAANFMTLLPFRLEDPQIHDLCATFCTTDYGEGILSLQNAFVEVSDHLPEVKQCRYIIDHWIVSLMLCKAQADLRYDLRRILAVAGQAHGEMGGSIRLENMHLLRSMEFEIANAEDALGYEKLAILKRRWGGDGSA
ncbi:3-hydroxyphenylacetate 6-hydroxylase [Sphaceloma murrayae]|uniref:3-hydroxyphenylacetate 6-hydroxylase n=1 Tax=Sphaceloma murrayae TaxID=2082308 RepID=A0A2K1QGC3_9PEZI|nr:3-hydroxyphenylacetate 6-hydroxylase [Sphaceloma murrayae]